MTAPETPQNRSLVTITVCLCLMLIGFTSWWASRDDALRTPCLNLISPVVNWLIPFGATVERDAAPLLRNLQQGLMYAAGSVALLFLVLYRRLPVTAVTTLLAFFAAVYGQTELLLGRLETGSALYALSGLLCAVLFFLPEISPDESKSGKNSPGTIYEVSLFLLIFLIGLLLRFYQLNRILNFFEGEQTPFSIAGNDLGAMQLANVGHYGPWSPFGYIYFFLVFVPTKLFGTTLLSLRLGSAIPGMLMILLVYFFTRRTFSHVAALAAAFILAIDGKQVSWSRYEFPHGATAITAILITWLTYHVFKSGKTLPCIGLCLCMGLCFHQYPSGQTAFLIPWLYCLYLMIFHRGKGGKFYAKRIPVLICGTLLWYYGHSFAQYFAYGQWLPPNYLARFDTRVGWKTGDASVPEVSQLLGLFVSALGNFADYVRALVYKVTIPPPPQDFIPAYGNLPIRTIFMAVPPLVLITLSYFIRFPRRSELALMFCWLLVALLPCVLSDEAAPRRAATSFPALICLAGIGYSVLRAQILAILGLMGRLALPVIEVGLLVTLTVASVHQWFANTTLRAGEPGELTIQRKIEELSKPGTIVALDFEDHYMIGRMTYLMLDFLNADANRPITWLEMNREATEHFPQILADPRSAVSLVESTLMYRWSNLIYQVPDLKNYGDWRRFIYITERFPNSHGKAASQERVQKIREQCQNRQEFDYLTIPNFYHHFFITVCDLAPLPPQ